MIESGEVFIVNKEICLVFLAKDEHYFHYDYAPNEEEEKLKRTVAIIVS